MEIALWIFLGLFVGVILGITLAIILARAERDGLLKQIQVKKDPVTKAFENAIRLGRTATVTIEAVDGMPDDDTEGANCPFAWHDDDDDCDCDEATGDR